MQLLRGSILPVLVAGAPVASVAGFGVGAILTPLLESCACRMAILLTFEDHG